MAYRELELTLLSAWDLKNVNLFMRMEVYAVASISGDPMSRQCTPTDTSGGSYPSWNTTLRFHVAPNAKAAGDGWLHVLLRSQRALGDRDVGEVIVPLAELLAGADGTAGSLPARTASYQVHTVLRGEPRGVLYVSYRLGPVVAPVAGGTNSPSMGYPPPQQPYTYYKPPPPESDTPPQQRSHDFYASQPPHAAVQRADPPPGTPRVVAHPAQPQQPLKPQNPAPPQPPYQYGPPHNSYQAAPRHEEAHQSPVNNKSNGHGSPRYYTQFIFNAAGGGGGAPAKDEDGQTRSKPYYASAEPNKTIPAKEEEKADYSRPQAALQEQKKDKRVGEIGARKTNDAQVGEYARTHSSIQPGNAASTWPKEAYATNRSNSMPPGKVDHQSGPRSALQQYERVHSLQTAAAR